MKVPVALVTVIVAVLAQTVLVRYAVGGAFSFDLVLVGVVYVALRWDARAGVVGGTIGGLLQDLLSGGVVGVGGLAKTLVGGAAGGLGAQFVVTRPDARALIVAGASLVHRLLMVGMVALINEQWPALPWADMLMEAGVNAACAWVLFQGTDALPAALERRRMRRQSRWGRRRW
ncbi:MAG TPA: rod shape-determining protein MreD [Vicinamibacterales bacterium]|nr:rod shape-determining protein MreD [Vicinamibacterales bacterium]